MNKLALAARNVGVLAGQALWNTSQDLSKLRFNTFIISALFMVTARSVEANWSALRARNTKEADFRAEQAARTTFRELTAWALSYLFLRLLQGRITGVLKGQSLLNKATGVKLFDIAKSKSEGMLSKVGHQLKAVVSGQPLERLSLNLKPYLGDALTKPAFGNEGLVNRLYDIPGIGIKALAKIRGIEHQPMANQVDGAIELWSIGIASLPTMLLSGVALETVNQKYGVQIFQSGIDRFKHWRHPELATKTTDKAPVFSEVHQADLPSDAVELVPKAMQEKTADGVLAQLFQQAKPAVAAAPQQGRLDITENAAVYPLIQPPALGITEAPSQLMRPPSLTMAVNPAAPNPFINAPRL